MANNFLPFCPTDTGTNLLTQGDYAVDPQRTIGNQPGVASSKLVNKAIRQSSMITSQFAQYMEDTLGENILDDGNTSALLAQIAKVFNAILPSGMILPYGGATAPTTFLLCDGAAVSRTTYANLFDAIGTAWGEGDGSTTFNLPDLRGLVLRGVSGTSNMDPDKASRTALLAGGNTANNVGSFQGHAFQTHTHTQNAHNHGFGTYNGTALPAPPNAGNQPANTAPALANGVQTSNQGMWYNSVQNWNTTVVQAQTPTNQNATASGAHAQASANETRMVNAYVNYCIKI